MSLPLFHEVTSSSSTGGSAGSGGRSLRKHSARKAGDDGNIPFSPDPEPEKEVVEEKDGELNHYIHSMFSLCVCKRDHCTCVYISKTTTVYTCTCVYMTCIYMYVCVCDMYIQCTCKCDQCIYMCVCDVYVRTCVLYEYDLQCTCLSVIATSVYIHV